AASVKKPLSCEICHRRLERGPMWRRVLGAQPFAPTSRGRAASRGHCVRVVRRRGRLLEHGEPRSPRRQADPAQQPLHGGGSFRSGDVTPLCVPDAVYEALRRQRRPVYQIPLFGGPILVLRRIPCARIRSNHGGSCPFGHLLYELHSVSRGLERRPEKSKGG